jgi:hypothetical protein
MTSDMIWKDPIVEEVRRVRDAHAARFGYDSEAIYKDLKEQERLSGREFVRFPPKRCQPVGQGKPGQDA